MLKYPKIETVYNREGKWVDEGGQPRLEEFKLINEWLVTEKIDGTNIRIHFTETGFDISGRSDDAQIPAVLVSSLYDKARTMQPKVDDIRLSYGLETLTLFTEGYGPKIQKGEKYREDASIILFDVLVNDSGWLPWDAVVETALNLDLRSVPMLGYYTLDQAVELVRGGFPSVEAREDRQAEGIVARTHPTLYDARGNRIMWKLKTKDLK